MTVTAPAVVFDIDGTLLDSAPGIVAGFRYALSSVGFDAPDTDQLRADLGPPVGDIFTALGLPSTALAEAVRAYREFYLAYGLQQATLYAGVRQLLESLRAEGVSLGTATAKRTDVAGAILQHHDLARYFVAVNGTDDVRKTKTETIAFALHQLGGPDPAEVIMVGDRHFDVTGARDCGVVPVGVTWGYGSLAELLATGARLIDQPAELLALAVS
jgi:phosphoglycolate phosphatase